MEEAEKSDGYKISPAPVTSSRVGTTFQSPEGPELPLRSGEPLLLAIAKNPETLFVCWSVDWPAAFRGDLPPDRCAHARVSSNGEQRVLAVEPMSGSCMINGLQPGRTYSVELGYYGAAETWKIVATSNDVMMPFGVAQAEDGLEVATIPLHVRFQRMVDAFRLSNGGNIARIIAEFQQRAVTSASRYGDEAEILRALDLALEDLRETENRRRTLSKTQTIRRQTESLLGFGASSPAGNSWSGG